eukprot:m.538258 g.538258  ORF g.538258 m.538258 type:complete len:339 (-) comp22080_c0_seq7:1927-2943(-)
MFLGRRKWTRVLLLVAAAATFILYQRSTSSHIAVSEPGVRLGDPVPVVRRDRDLPPHEDREEPSHQQHRANTEEESRLKVERKVNGWDWSDDPLLVKSPLGDKLGPDVSPTRMHGTIGVRPDGTPGWTVTEWPTDHVETMEEKHEHHAHNCFNLARSDSITLDRDIPDARAPECRQQSYPTDLPQTSVVFVFYNEPLSPLFRSIHSVLNRSPPHLLKEIILVDDGSDAEWTQGPLEAYIKLLYRAETSRCHSLSHSNCLGHVSVLQCTGNEKVVLATACYKIFRFSVHNVAMYSVPTMPQWQVISHVVQCVSRSAVTCCCRGGAVPRCFCVACPCGRG